MSYANAAELRDRIGSSIFDEIYNVSDPSDLSDRSGIADDLEAAGAEIDGALAARYALPVTGARSLSLLKDWNLTLAEERAYARCAGSEFSEKVKRRVDQVRKYLEMIRADEFRLPDAAEKEASSGGGGIALVQRDTPIFGRDQMTGF